MRFQAMNFDAQETLWFRGLVAGFPLRGSGSITGRIMWVYWQTE
jgi:hypothetical protein